MRVTKFVLSEPSLYPYSLTKYCIPSSIQYVVLSDFINIFCGKNFIHFGACGFRMEPILKIAVKMCTMEAINGTYSCQIRFVDIYQIDLSLQFPG